MKNKIMLAIAGVVIVAATAACGGGSNSDSPEVIVKDRPTTTTTEKDDSAKIAWCASNFSEYSDALTELGELGSYVTTEAEIRAFIEAGREAVAAGRRGIRECGEYLPSSDVAEFEALLDELDTSLDTVEDLL